MKYQQLVLGIIIGMMISYAGMRVVHHIKRVGGLSAALANVGQPAQADNQDKPDNEMTFSTFQLTEQSKLGEVTFSYDFVPSNESHNAVMQIFLNVEGHWAKFNPSDTNGSIVFHLYKGLDCSGTFAIDVPKGTYTTYRLILFDATDGSNVDYSHVLWDSNLERHMPLPKMDLTVSSSVAPVNAPTLSFPPNPLEQSEGNGLTNVTLPVLVKYPVNYQVENGGFWVMAKGDAGFSQVWADVKDATQSSDPNDPYYEIPVNLELKDLKTGIWNVQLGLFKQSFGDPLVWDTAGDDFEVGGDSWVVPAPERRIPPRLKVVDDHFELLSGEPYNFYHEDPSGRAAVQYVRGGNYGNAITWHLQPALDTPGYFTLLAGAGCHYIRFNYNPDKYLEQRVYRDSVDQIVQNIWAAGLYPVIAPQDLPAADSLQQQIEKGDRLMNMVATKYAGKSVWIEVCNEPQEFSTWSAWKPVAERYVRTIRAVDPNAFVIVPFESYSKDSKGASLSPITGEHVDLYDGHAYVKPDEVSAAFGPAIKAGLPVIIGEYGSNDGDYLHKMDRSFQELSPPPVAVSPWAFTIKGEDSIPLVADGSTAQLTLTPAGQAISDDFSAWDRGQKIQ